jgi:hypothetical protein
MTMTSEPVFAPARLALLLQHFAKISDDRESWRVAYPLKEVLLLVTCATIANCDDFEAIVSCSCINETEAIVQIRFVSSGPFQGGQLYNYNLIRRTACLPPPTRCGLLLPVDPTRTGGRRD